MKVINKHAFMVAAPRSNSGKTLITLGLIKALFNKGFTVQPYKCGPDYIDPMHHKIVSGKQSYNLDTWMDELHHVKTLFEKHLQNADVGIVEGVMGLFDGANKSQGSSAEIARLLSLPVILVVDASSMAYSASPLLYGFKNFDSQLNLVGVIFNKTGSESHVRILAESAKDAGVEMLGYVPRDSCLNLESRHLGLHLPGETQNTEIVDAAAQLVDTHVDLNRLLAICQTSMQVEPTVKAATVKKQFTIAMACDQAFNFSYQANIDALNQLGNLVFFSPLKDAAVPEADILWLPGGYPELFAGELSENQSMIMSIKNYIEAGKPVVAECGGMMYLGKSIINKNGTAFQMAGVFNFSTSFKEMKLHLGYREICLNQKNIKGHEFHYSNLIELKEKPFINQAKTAQGRTVDLPVFRYKNCWASYMHLYLGNTEAMRHFLKEIIHDK